MRCVLPSKLWTANARQVRDIRSVLSEGITAVVDLAIEEPPVTYPRDILYARFPLVDGGSNHPELLKAVISSVVHLLKADRPTVVACSGGMSRSPLIAAAAIAQFNGISFEDAIMQVASEGPADFAPALVSDLYAAIQPKEDAKTRPNLLVLRSRAPEETVRFYQTLDLRFVEEQHGNGPIHWAAEASGFVLEIYPPKKDGAIDTSTTVGFDVIQLEPLVASLKAEGFQVVRGPEVTPWGKQSIVRDPDGRTVILTRR
ncbi:hypothetical protein GC197_09700 [bacterium]|nr:hypothetical protein [bacterium]